MIARHAAVSYTHLDVYKRQEGRLVIMAPKEEAEGIVETLRKCPYSAEAAIIGEVVAEEPGKVVMETEIGKMCIRDSLCTGAVIDFPV